MGACIEIDYISFLLDNSKNGLLESKLKRIIFCLCLFACFSLLCGCETTHHIKKDTTFIPHNWSTIGILPFSGEQAFAKISAELFTFHMLKQKHFKIIQPAIAEIILRKKDFHMSQDLGNIQEAQEAGNLLGAEAVILGNIKILRMKKRAIADLKLIDTKRGDIIASIVLEDQNCFSLIEHDHVTAAITEASKEMLLVLEGLSGKIAIPVK